MKKTTITIGIFIAYFLIISCDNKENITPLPELIELKEASLYPEGIVYNSQDEIIMVGSYHKGKILTVDIAGNLKDFIKDESLVSVVGMAIDTSKNWLVVCNSDAGLSVKSDNSTIGKLAEIVIYNLSTGEKIKTIDLSTLIQGGHFLNDVITDNQGTIFVTDSFSPVIYKIDSKGNASVLVNDSQFEVPQGAFGLNGIVYHPDNYLIIGRAFGGKLYKIPLDNPIQVSEITLDKSVNSLDGLLLTDPNTLVLVSNNFTGAPFKEAVYQITTTNNWSTGKIKNTFSSFAGSFPTTATVINDTVYVNYGYFPDLVNQETAPIETFKIQKVLF